MNPPTEHPNREQLTAFLSGDLDAAAQDVVAAHIADCDRCCDALRAIPDDAFVAILQDASTPSDTGDIRKLKGSRDQSLPIELRDHPRYKVGKFLGAGGMGLVYQAEHRLMDRVVALKILHRDLIRHPRIVQRFRQEVKAAARLAHPNIVTAYDADQAGDAHFLVMEFVDGVSLDRLVKKRGPVDVAEACHFVRQAAVGLQHAFEAGMVHRDIKPQNLMLTRKGQVKILDFGLARLASESRAEFDLPAGRPARETDQPSLTSFGDVIGTPDYMAPEQVFDSSQADIRADIYGLGCTLYYLLTGRTPFAPGSARTNVRSRKYVPPQPIANFRDDLPPNVIQIVEKMMAKEPADRYQTPAEIVKVLAPLEKAAIAKPALGAAARKPALVVDAAGNEARTFLARCPFCLTRIRIPERAQGASLPCPQCSSFFTAVPEDEGG